MSRSSLPRKPVKRLDDELARHRGWLERAVQVANSPVSQGGSPHPTVKVGAVLVDAKGREIAAAANRFAQGVDRRRPERYISGSKSLWINCAEQMILIDALRRGVKIKGARLYVTLEPCATCAGLIAESGIRDIFVPVGAMRRYAKLKAKYKESIEVGLVKLAEAGVCRTALEVGRTAEKSRPRRMGRA